jgi:hypothetical protein
MHDLDTVLPPPNLAAARNILPCLSASRAPPPLPGGKELVCKKKKHQRSRLALLHAGVPASHPSYAWLSNRDHTSYFCTPNTDQLCPYWFQAWLGPTNRASGLCEATAPSEEPRRAACEPPRLVWTSEVPARMAWACLRRFGPQPRTWRSRDTGPSELFYLGLSGRGRTNPDHGFLAELQRSGSVRARTDRPRSRLLGRRLRVVGLGPHK